MDKVSYVITVYNKEKYLPLVLHSLASQTGEFEKEFIFVDDGSTDRSAHVIKELSEKLNLNAHVISQNNMGPSIATNAGMKLATGNFIKLVDGDDSLMPWATEILLSGLKNNPVSYAMSYHRLPINIADFTISEYDNRSREIKKSIPETEWKIDLNPLKHVLKHSNSNPTCILAPKDAWLKLGGCHEDIFVQDYFLELSLACQGAADVWDGPIFFFPKGDESRVSANEAQIMHDLNHALAEFIDRAPGLNRNLIQYSCKRASSRAWRFIKGKPVSMRKKLYILSLYLKSIMLFPDHPKNHILKTRQAFEWAGHIRTPGKHR